MSFRHWQALHVFTRRIRIGMSGGLGCQVDNLLILKGPEIGVSLLEGLVSSQDGEMDFQASL